VGRLPDHCPPLTGQGASGEQLIGQSLRRHDVECESKASPFNSPPPRLLRRSELQDSRYAAYWLSRRQSAASGSGSFRALSHDMTIRGEPDSPISMRRGGVVKAARSCFDTENAALA
jgi:hypothetical protein